MYRPRSKPSARRRGVILLVVVTLLTLFAVVGLSFMLYAESEATASRVWREAIYNGTPSDAPDPAVIFNSVLGDIIYPVPDTSGVFKGVRGYELSRFVYGWNYNLVNGAVMPIPTAPNTIPWNGIGRLHYPSVFGMDDAQLLNYTYFLGDGFVRDPERISTRTDPTQQPGAYVPVNAGYTAADLSNLYLAAVSSNGTVLAPSYHRPSVFNPGQALNDVSNPNWTSPQGKYLILRPRPIDHTPAFPYPTDATGDVKNLEGAPGGNDSVWLDFDLPVQTWNGKQYKPLVALLVVDLDGRVNLNVAGSLKVSSDGSVSNQGLGGWEVNPKWVMAPASAQQDAQNLLTGATSPVGVPVLGRYGGNATPDFPDGYAGPPSPNTMPHSYAPIDFDGSDLGNPSTPPRVVLPTGLQTLPTWPARYLNGTAPEQNAHPGMYNPYLAPTSWPTNQLTRDLLFGPWEMRRLNYKYSGDSAQYAVSTPGQLAPNSFVAGPAPGSPNPRFLVTTISNDLDRLALPPWQQDPLNKAYSFQQAPVAAPMPNTPVPPATQPVGQQIPFPGAANRGSLAPAGNGDFDPNWRSNGAKAPWASLLGAIDMNRPLTNYNAAGNPPGDVTNFAQAQLDRQNFAQDIFLRLVAAAGADYLNTPLGQPEYFALRWLAQLAVNMVDYIDTDEYMTPFIWNQQRIANGSMETPEILWGTELPRLVVNESFVRYENDPNDPGIAANQNPQKATQYLVKVWAELHNPLTPPGGTDATLTNGGAATLINAAGQNVYQILLTKRNYQLRSVTNFEGRPDNVTPPIMNPPPAGGQIYKIVNAFGGAMPKPPVMVQPSNGGYGRAATIGTNPSFFLIGPNQLPGNDNVTPDAVTDQMSYIVTVADATAAGNANAPPPPTLMLQRLACPDMPAQTDPTQANYNPYITVDYAEYTGTNQLNDGMGITPNGPKDPNLKYDPTNINPQAIVPPENQYSWGRRQPYAGYTPLLTQQVIVPSVAGQINHTFLRHNGSTATQPMGADTLLDQPFQWLAHLDRQLTSPVELMCVSAWKPHELTQQFVQGTLMNNQPQNETFQQHLAQWNPVAAQPNQPTGDNYRLFRALEYLRVGNRTLGLGLGGRVPGRINLNTVYDLQTFMALCDPGTANYFDQTMVTTAFQQIIAQRHPNFPVVGTPNDQPVLGPGAAITAVGDTQYPTGSGIARTILNPALKVPGQTHPYLQNEFMSKIFNNATTRSNAFAVWATIGYFEVANPGPYTAANRPKLGAELGSSNGTTVRHKFFAVIDRTNLSINPSNPQLQGPKPVFFSSPLAATGGQPVVVTVPAVRQDPDGSLVGYYDQASGGATWRIAVGTQLAVDVGANQEAVTVTAVTPPTGTGTSGQSVGATVAFACARSHPAGFVISTALIGNPGPQPGFTWTAEPYNAVVPYVERIR